MSVRRNILWYSVPSIMERSAAFLLLPLYVRLLPPEEFGTAAVALAVATVSGLLVSPSTESVYMRFLVPPPRRREVAGIALLHLLIAIAGTALLLTFAEPISALLMPGIPTRPFYYVAVLATAFSTFIVPIRAEWRARHQAGRVAALEGARVVVSVTTILVALLWLDLGAVSILLGRLAEGILLLPLGLHKIGQFIRAGWPDAAIREVLPLFSVGLPMGISAHALVTVDRLLLHRIQGEEAVAVYAVGFGVGAVVIAATTVMNREWRPLVLGLAAGQDPDEGELQKLWTQSLGLFLAVGGMIAFLAGDFVDLIAGSEYQASAAVVPWIVVIGVLGIPRVFLHGLSIAAGAARDLLVESVATLGVFLTACALLIPPFGPVGAAASGALAYAAGVAFLFSRDWNLYRLDRSILPWMGLFLVGIILGSSMAGSLATRLLGILVLGLLVREALRYWRYLGTLRPTAARA